MTTRTHVVAATALGLTLALGLAAPAWAQSRDQIRAVGSSTVFPFTTAVAEAFGKTGKFKTPVVESTGTGGGLKLFCAGVGPAHPDIANASRRIKKSEIDQCAGNAANLKPEEIEEFSLMSNFSELELKRLYRRFKKLDKDGSGTLTTDEFLSIPEFASNPLLERVIAIFDTNKDEEIEFKEFISALSIFSSKENKEAKLRFAFRIYDIDDDGFISNGELFQVLKMMVGSNLNDIQLQQIVDKTVLEADQDKDGKISFDEFVKMINNTDEIDQKLTFSLDAQQ